MKKARYRLYQEIFKTESVEEILMIIAGIYGKEAFYDAICKLKAYEYADKSIGMHWLVRMRCQTSSYLK